jgi:hypothetical protein
MDNTCIRDSDFAVRDDGRVDVDLAAIEERLGQLTPRVEQRSEREEAARHRYRIRTSL